MCESVVIFQRDYFHGFQENSQAYLETVLVAGVKENVGVHWSSFK